MKYLAVTSFLFLIIIDQSFSDLKFAGWGKKCKIDTGTDILDSQVECDAGRGLTCQTYTQGELCGCSSKVLTYDRRSLECRRKVSSACHLTKTKEEYDKQSFNHKCHENAECVIYSGTLIGGKAEAERKKTNEAKPVCLCKHGYVSAPDLSECRDPNGESRLKSSVYTILGVALSCSFIQFMFG